MSKFHIRDIVIFAVLGAVMYLLFMVMQGIPNVQPLAVIMGAVTLTYRKRALIPIYVFVMIYGIISGISIWWIPYLYIWLPLWGAFMLAGKLNVSKKVQVPLYMAICALHGLLFGIMYAPVQAVFFGLDFKGIVAWVIAGIWYDVIHAVSNLFLAVLVLPLAELMRRVDSAAGDE